jgi:nucleoside-diphosphate-sugar epimerase
VAAKAAASIYGRLFHALYRAPVVIGRPGMVYGPGQAVDKVIPNVILSLLAGKKPALSSGRLQADWIYIDDVVEGLVATATRPGLEGQAVDLGTGTLTSVRDIVAELVRKINTQVQPVFGALPDRPLEQVRAANIAATHELLGWLPRTALSEGLDRTISWFRTARGP